MSSTLQRSITYRTSHAVNPRLIRSLHVRKSTTLTANSRATLGKRDWIKRPNCHAEHIRVSACVNCSAEFEEERVNLAELSQAARIVADDLYIPYENVNGCIDLSTNSNHIALQAAGSSTGTAQDASTYVAALFESLQYGSLDTGRVAPFAGIHTALEAAAAALASDGKAILVAPPTSPGMVERLQAAGAQVALVEGGEEQRSPMVTVSELRIELDRATSKGIPVSAVIAGLPYQSAKEWGFWECMRMVARYLPLAAAVCMPCSEGRLCIHAGEANAPHATPETRREARPELMIADLLF
ncbi:hypothetical protein CYMTET_29397 [Cymbomonas tetramitiformis]|uniref:Uncharacterized protein n=1 Tax=Cymbomonas tetramitiformis TaxID=36881 RepID=A0AAE0KUY8_9CHLO|nr:hypothetical protein CYMTET_29397 [Cymbomonas tetramitiformis]